MSDLKKLQGASVLITGGNGAVGCNLVNALQDLNAKVTVIDNFSQSDFKNLRPSKNLKIVKGDITQQGDLTKVFSTNYDYVFHLAARFANELSVKDPIKDLKVNILGTLQVLLQSSKQKIDRFIYTSSSSIYGPQKLTKLQESSTPKPSTPYAASKLSGENYCMAMSQLYDLDYVILRLSNSYGPYDPPGKYRNVIPNFFSSAIKGKDLIITGTGNETRDFTYVEDCVKGILLAATKSGNNQIFNLGTGKETKIKKIASIILNVTNSKSRIVYCPMRNFDHIKNRKMDISKASKILGYKPSTTIEEGIKKTHTWFVNNYSK